MNYLDTSDHNAMYYLLSRISVDNVLLTLFGMRKHDSNLCVDIAIADCTLIVDGVASVFTHTSAKGAPARGFWT